MVQLRNVNSSGAKQRANLAAADVTLGQCTATVLRSCNSRGARVSSAWLMLRYIDSHAKFAFDKNPGRHPDAIPFDMFNASGFGHVGNDCTFETLVKSFSVKDSRLRLVAQAIHDADLADDWDRLRIGREPL
jgi:hypothetical protein